MAYIGGLDNVRRSTRKVKLFFQCDARIYFNHKSRDLIFTDEKPRFSLELHKLRRLCHFSDKAKSVDWGYHRYNELGAWVKNVEYDEVQCDMMFSSLKMQTPFGWSAVEDYTEYAKETFNPIQQRVWKSQYRNLKSKGKELKDASTGRFYVPVIVSHFDNRDVAVVENVDFNPLFKLTQL